MTQLVAPTEVDPPGAAETVPPLPVPKRAPKPPRPPRVPKPPRRPPRPERPAMQYSSQEQLARGAFAILAALLLSFIANLTVLSHVQHLAAQQQLTNTYREQLAEGTAPVSEGDVDDVLLADGVPVAILSIPGIGVDEVVVEGTDAATLKTGPGHRRDTVLPGQAGVSVIMGRAAAYGGPFARLQELHPGEEFSVITGQGEQEFEVIGLRYAGDPAPPSLKAGESRLVLETARGMPYAPTGVVRVDARLTSEVQPPGARDSSFRTLPLEDRELATDTSMVWALVFALQFLIVIELALVWSIRRIGLRQTWIVFVPLVFLGSLLVADQATRLLPNLL